MSTLRVCLLLITASATAWGGWRHDCRVATHDFRKECRQAKGVTTTTSTTTTTLPAVTLAPYHGFVSENCTGTPQGCVTVRGGDYDGKVLCPPIATMAVCSFPAFCPPPSGSPSGAF
jgi:hypothetical protein